MSKKRTDEQRPELEPTLDSRHFVEHPARGSRYRNFDEFWFQLKTRRNLDDGFKAQIWTYFKSTGILNDPAEYEAGLRNFGLGD